MTEKIGLFVTRCQPGFHDGHIDSIREAIAAGITKIIIGVGSADKEFTKDNPFTYEERKSMIQLSLKAAGLDGSIEIYPLPHSNDSEQWRNYILNNLPHFDYLISSNPMVEDGFKGTDKKYFLTSVTTTTRSSVIRNKISLGDYDYIDKVLCKEVTTYLKKIDAFERLKDIFKDERVTPNIAVDVIFDDENGKLVLINRNHPPEGIALPGGFVEYGESVEQACIRKAKQETGADIKIKKLVGVYDNLKRDPRNHNISIVYRAELVGSKTDRESGNKKVIKLNPEDLNTIAFAFPDHEKMITEAYEKTF